MNMFILHVVHMAGRCDVSKKVIQTELADNEYQLLKETLAKRGLSIKEGVREAVHQWLGTQMPIAEDPLFKIKPVQTGVKTDSGQLHKELYRSVNP